MSPKAQVMIGLFIGSSIGGYIPVLFGASLFSYISVIGSAVGGLLGIYIAYKLTTY